MRWLTIAFAEENEGLIVADVDGEASVLPGGPSGRVSAAAVGQSLELGYGGCLEGWPHGERTATLRFGAFDAAGNFSGWTEPEEFSLGGCGCRTRPGREPVPAIMILLGGFVLPERRRLSGR
jgi:hypothetical protein